MPKDKPSPEEAKHQAVKEIAGLVDAFCKQHLNDEYADPKAYGEAGPQASVTIS